MTDRISKVTIPSNATPQFIAGICHALSDETGRVVVEISAADGGADVQLRRRPLDASIPMFLRPPRQVRDLHGTDG